MFDVFVVVVEEVLWGCEYVVWFPWMMLRIFTELLSNSTEEYYVWEIRKLVRIGDAASGYVVKRVGIVSGVFT